MRDKERNEESLGRYTTGRMYREALWGCKLWKQPERILLLIDIINYLILNLDLALSIITFYAKYKIQRNKYFKHEKNFSLKYLVFL